MSSYDAAIIDTTILEDPALLALPRGTRLLHIEGYVWSRAQRTDGAIPRYLLPRIAFGEPDAEAAAAALVAAGLWAETEAGWTIIDFLTTQWSRATVRRKRANNRKRYEEWVAKQEGGKRPPRSKSKDNALANARANDTDTDADSDPDPEREGESAGRNGDADDPSGSVVALLRRDCVVCHHEFLGIGYDLEGLPICSRRCQERWRAA